MKIHLLVRSQERQFGAGMEANVPLEESPFLKLGNGHAKKISESKREEE